MKKTIIAGIAMATAAVGFMASAEEVNRTYLRKGDQEIRVFTVDGKLFCRRVSDEFEMCHGMENTGVGTFAGPNMKHPDMMAFMTFDGTVVIGGNAKLSIEGCMVGGAVCDKEIWDEKQ